MRLLYLSPWFPFPLDTGSRTRVYYLLKSLAPSHKVVLLTLDPAGWSPAKVTEVAEWCDYVEILHQDPFQRSQWLKTTRFFSFSPIVTIPFKDLTRKVQALHRQDSFDIVIAATTVMATYALSLPEVPRILEEHNSHTRWMAERYQQQTNFVQKVRCWASWQKSRSYESNLFSKFNHVTMVSDEDVKSTQDLLPGRFPPVSLIPNGVDCEILRPGLVQPNQNTLIFSGSLAYQANYEAMAYFLAEVYPLIRTQIPSVSLRITGAIQGITIDALHLDESVTLTGFVDDIHREIAGATVSVVPILTGGGTRLKVLEAMALGVPIVSTFKGAEGLNVEHGKHLLLAKTAEEFATNTLELLTNEGLRQQLSNAARQLVLDSYDWVNIGQKFNDLVAETHSQWVGQKRKGAL